MWAHLQLVFYYCCRSFFVFPLEVLYTLHYGRIPVFVHTECPRDFVSLGLDLPLTSLLGNCTQHGCISLDSVLEGFISHGTFISSFRDKHSWLFPGSSLRKRQLSQAAGFTFHASIFDFMDLYLLVSVPRTRVFIYMLTLAYGYSP